MRVLDENELYKCQISIARDVYERQLLNREGWLILGDETGGFSEFRGKKFGRPSRMLWIVVPPSTTLQNLHPFYHGQDAEWFENETITAFENLIKNEEVGCFIFTHEDGLSPNPNNLKSKVAQKAHLLMWQFTLPLVLEWVSSKISKKEKVSIYVERVDSHGLEPGEMPLVSIMQEFVEGLKTRKSWSNLSFKEHRILAKEPIEHPWLGYTDCLGHIYNEILSEPMRELAEIMKKRIFSHPYRQTSLNGSIRQALKNTARPLVFLQSLSSISPADIRDYIEPFFQGAISEALESLTSSEWQELLLHIDSTSKTKQGQEASNLIMRFVNLDATLEKLTNKRDQFDLLLAVLGTSNHVGRTDLANRCKVLIEIMREDGFTPPRNRLRKLENLSGGANDNQFDFSHISDDWGIPEDDYEIDEEEARYLGAQAVSRALRGEEGDLQIAWNIEQLLLKQTFNHSDLRRRYIYRSELLMDKGEFESAKQALEIELPQSVNLSNNEQLLSDSYYLASLLKACALTDAGIETYNRYQRYAIQSLNENHPSQRIAYWFARWSADIAQSESPHAKQCIQHLLDLKQEKFFTKEAPGVILACELMDLESRGLIETDAASFMEEVIANSEPPYTEEWVAAHPPNVDDWLAPLNFNYR